MFYFCEKLENGTSILNTHTHTHGTHWFSESEKDREAPDACEESLKRK